MIIIHKNTLWSSHVSAAISFSLNLRRPFLCFSMWHSSVRNINPLTGVGWLGINGLTLRSIFKRILHDHYIFDSQVYLFIYLFVCCATKLEVIACLRFGGTLCQKGMGRMSVLRAHPISATILVLNVGWPGLCLSMLHVKVVDWLPSLSVLSAKEYSAQFCDQHLKECFAIAKQLLLVSL